MNRMKNKILILTLIVLAFLLLWAKFLLMYMQNHAYFYVTRIYHTINLVQNGVDISLIALATIVVVLFIKVLRDKDISLKMAVIYVAIFVSMLFLSQGINGYFHVTTGYLYSPVIVEKNLESNFILVQSPSFDDVLIKLYCTPSEMLLLEPDDEYTLFTYRSVNNELEGYLTEEFQ